MKRFIAVLFCMIFIISLAACSNENSYDLGSADRARVFYNTYYNYVESAGEANTIDNALSGAAVIRLKDFTGDGIYEMLILYSSEKNGVVDKVMVCGFDMGFAMLLDEEITSKESKDADTSSLWVYTDSSNTSYLVKGDDLSGARSYCMYMQADADGQSLYSFAEAFATDGNDLSGTYEKIDIVGADSKAVFAENEKVLNSIESQKN